MAKSRHNGNGHGHITETPDMSHVRNIDVTHELSDVDVAGILKFVVGLVVMMIVVFLLNWLLFDLLNAQEAKKESDRPRGPMAMSEQERLPPDPRLQAAPGFGVKLENGQWVSLEKSEPQAEYRVLRDQWEHVLQEGVKDPAGNVVVLPIDEAMQKLIQNGLPVRTKTPPEEPGSTAQDYGLELPTAASSGRVTVKRKQ
jgi:hypothetical protein